MKTPVTGQKLLWQVREMQLSEQKKMLLSVVQLQELRLVPE